MIYYNYAFRKHKTVYSLAQAKAIGGVIFNRLNYNNEDISGYIDEFKKENLEIIYDNPIYCSSMIDFRDLDDKKQDLTKLIFDRNEILDEKIYDVLENKLNNYFIESKDIDAEKVLGIPLDNLLTRNRERFLQVYKSVHLVNYSYISTMISLNDDEAMLDNKFNILKEISQIHNIAKILLTISTRVHDEPINNSPRINGFINNLNTIFKKVVLHHGLNVFPHLEGVKDVAFCGFKQGNSTSVDIAPFKTFGDWGISSPWVFSSKLFSQVSVGKLANNIGPLSEEMINEGNLEYFKNEFDEMNRITSYYSRITTTKTHINEIRTALSIQEILDMDMTERRRRSQEIIRNNRNILNTYKKIQKSRTIEIK